MDFSKKNITCFTRHWKKFNFFQNIFLYCITLASHLSNRQKNNCYMFLPEFMWNSGKNSQSGHKILGKVDVALPPHFFKIIFNSFILVYILRKLRFRRFVCIHSDENRLKIVIYTAFIRPLILCIINILFSILLSTYHTVQSCCTFSGHMFIDLICEISYLLFIILNFHAITINVEIEFITYV